ncbi:MAG: acetate--CoA ligase [Candidatus Diapherotrites archaeon]|nr:acetate--CoA ligase [Candidatus Diapherotrites archaeon]
MKNRSYLRKLRIESNLKNYDEMKKHFKWSKFKKEIHWMEKDKLNTAVNSVDKHIGTVRENKVALIWEGEKGEEKKFTFREIYELSNRFANVLKKFKIKKGQRVFVLLQRVPELYYSHLGSIKYGAVAGTMFPAFGPDAIYDRLENSEAVALITDSELVKRVDEVKKKLPKLKHIFVIDKPKGKEIDFHKEMEKASEHFKPKALNPEDFAFMLYTSGTTGKPKGVLHAHRSALYEHLTAKWVLDIHDTDVYWCTADPGWVTGIAYGILGSWSNGATSLVYAGRFDAEKWYELIQKYSVTIWYTAPTAVRLLMGAGEETAKKFDLTSLRHLCSVGEPLNPEPIKWSLKVFGLPFHDNFWQTETGGIVIANYPSMKIKAGSMGKPFPGIHAAIVDDEGKELTAGKEGNLALKPPWPGLMKTIWKQKKRFDKYFLNKWYLTGDKAMKDSEGYFWFVGRGDDIIKTSGERVGPFEVESALISHPSVLEAGVIGKPDALKGEIIKAFVVLRKGVTPSDALKNELQMHVKKNYAGHAYPREIEFIEELPKTQSGKILRRVLKAKESGLDLGDTSTFAK